MSKKVKVPLAIRIAQMSKAKDIPHTGKGKNDLSINFKGVIYDFFDELKKCELCYELRKEGKDFVTEATFNGGRADILVLDDFRVIEVLCSEKEDDCVNKVLKYPEELDVEIVKVKN